MQHTIETIKQYQCRHIFTDGHRCASTCLRQEEFCYYHHTTRKPITNPQQRRSRRSTFHLPLPEDRSAIQSSIGEVLRRIASNDIDPRRAGLLLYGLQIASLNLPKTQPTTKTVEPQTVEEITIDPTLGILAPRAEVSEITQRKSPVAQLIERMMQTEEEPTTHEPTTIPTIQATDESCILTSNFIKERPSIGLVSRRRGSRCSQCIGLRNWRDGSTQSALIRCGYRNSTLKRLVVGFDPTARLNSKTNLIFTSLSSLLDML
jgi:hypothetical protein